MTLESACPTVRTGLPSRRPRQADVVHQAALSTVLDEFAATVTGEYGTEDLLRQLAEGAVRVLDLDGAGVMVPEGEELLRLVFATGPAAAGVTEVEKLQELLQSGPCRDARRRLRPVVVGDLAVEGDWPEYQAMAVEVGLHAVAAVPLLARGRVWGVLDLYRCRPGALAGPELAEAQTLANLATSYLVVAHDRDQARQAQAELAHLAMHDPLTGLPVRWVFLELLSHALARLPRQRGAVAVLFADLDGLKYVNDRFGHPAGDRLLQVCVQRIRDALRPSDVVARLGGDEFVVLIEEVSGPGALAAVAQRVLDELAQPYRPDSGTVQPSASIGGALTSDPLAAPETLLAHADAAMYRAKRRGRGGFELSEPGDYEAEHERATEREQLVTALRAGLQHGEFELHYQPIWGLQADGTPLLYAVEALARWRHPERGLLTADAFIEPAEQAGLLVDLGDWVLRTACRQLASWDDAFPGRAPGRVFVNVSVGELAQPGLVAQVASALGDAGLPAGRLTVEITETGVMSDRVAVGEALSGLCLLGCELAIDDFGAGQSSLSRLVRIPAGILKVDRSFTRDLTRDQGADTVIAAVLGLGRDLGRVVVVEGVEDAATLSRLRELGVTHVQGYHLARPQGAAALEALLA